jgi:hypothetical protein
MELTNETVAAASEISCRFGLRCRIRNIGSANDTIRWREASVRVRGFNGRSVDDETEQQ